MPLPKSGGVAGSQLKENGAAAGPRHRRGPPARRALGCDGELGSRVIPGPRARLHLAPRPARFGIADKFIQNTLVQDMRRKKPTCDRRNVSYPRGGLGMAVRANRKVLIAKTKSCNANLSLGPSSRHKCELGRYLRKPKLTTRLVPPSPRPLRRRSCHKPPSTLQSYLT
jgi:hypothetical protein